jgi:signal transduction histidine kinase
VTRTLRIYAIASLLAILAAGSALAALYHDMVAHDIVAETGDDDVAMVRRALEPVSGDLAVYLTAVSTAAGQGAEPNTIPPVLARAFREMTREPRVVGINVFNRNGVISASTKSTHIGASERDNPGFISAIDGRMMTRAAEDNAAHRSDFASNGLKLVESYIPVPLGPAAPLGVVEIYSDVTPLLQGAQHSEVRFLGFAALIIAGLCVALWLIARAVLGNRDATPDTIGDDSALVTLLSQRSLRREELARKKFSFDLREDLAQTLSAIKLALERDHAAVGRSESEIMKSVVPDLQKAINQVRAMATELRHPGLDDFGLTAAIKALAREFGAAHPNIRVALQFRGGEASIPVPLQIVIYRNIEVALNAIGMVGTACDVWVALQVRFRTVMLVIKEEWSADPPRSDLADLAGSTGSPLSPIRERTLISGGRLSISRKKGGALILRASWSLRTGTRRA